MSNAVKHAIRCGYCAERAFVLQGELAKTKYPGWTRYACKNGHRFAVVTHSVIEKRPQLSN